MSIFRLFCLSMGVISSTFADPFKNTSGKDNIHHEIMATQNVDDIVGVSSVASVSSMNGKVSSVGGVKFFPAPGKGMTKNGGTMMFSYPINANKGMASGSIQLNPRSLTVSSSSYNTRTPERNAWQAMHPMFDPIINWPIMNDYVFPPQAEIFDPTNNIDPWFPKNMINSYGPLKPDMRNAWLYHNLNPFFNLWR